MWADWRGQPRAAGTPSKEWEGSHPKCRVERGVVWPSPRPCLSLPWAANYLRIAGQGELARDDNTALISGWGKDWVILCFGGGTVVAHSCAFSHYAAVFSRCKSPSRSMLSEPPRVFGDLITIGLDNNLINILWLFFALKESVKITFLIRTKKGEFFVLIRFWYPDFPLNS